MPICTRLTRVRDRSAAVALAAAAFSLAGAGSCTGASTSAGSGPRTVTQVTGTEPARLTLSLGQPCVASGIETCFNATDDDCNGLVDEGCGLDSGPLQIVVAWPDADADVDLLVVGPDHEPLLLGQVTANGLVKDWDCPSNLDACRGQNTEVVRSLGETLPLGTYEVQLFLKRAAPNGETTEVRLGGHIGDDSLQARVALSAANPRISWKLLRFVPKPAGPSR